MLNIVLIGYGELVQIIDRVDQILSDLDLANDAVITDINSSVYPAANAVERAPYIIVRSTNSEEADQIAKAINEKLNEDVEIEVIRGFLSKRKHPE